MLSKILPVFFSPTVIILALLAVGLWTRRRLWFASAGFEVIPYPVDLRVVSEKNLIEAWVPAPSALGKVSLVVRELIGRTYYRLMIAAGRVSY